MTQQTYWNNEPCKARIVRVIVGKADKPTFWYADLEGTEREAVEISDANQAGEQPFYIDNENNEGWIKVTEGKGSMWYPHSSLEIEKVIEVNNGNK